MMGFVKNLFLAASTASAHLTDDPVVLALQISRRLPSELVFPVARSFAKAVPKSFSAPSLLAAHISGDAAGLERRFTYALLTVLAPNRARGIADLALAAGLPDWADKFLPLAAGSRRLPSTVARRKWHGGDMSGAVDVLANQKGSLARQHDRLVGEQRVFSGWRPVLDTVSMEPVPGRVLHLLTNSLPHTGSGYAQRSHSILTAQQEEGWEVLAVTRLGYPVQVGKLTAKEKDVVDGVTYRRMVPSGLAATADARMQQEAEHLMQIALEFRPQVLHTTTHFVNGIVVAAVSKALGIPWVYEVRGQLADTWASTRGDEAKSSERYRSFVAAETAVMRDADVVFTLGEAMKDGIVSQGIASEHIMLVPNAVGGAYLEEPGTPAAARKMLGLDPELNYIGTVSSLVDYEGIDDLIEAFAILAPEFPQLRLLLVGSGAAEPALRSQTNRLGLGERTVFTGRVTRSKAPLYHRAMDIFVVPRKDLDVTRAVTPLKPVEALASARPVVASDLPALREIIEPDVNGSLSAPEDPCALALALSTLLRDSALRIRLGIAGRSCVMRTRTWSANAAVYSAAYKKVTYLPQKLRSSPHD